MWGISIHANFRPMGYKLVFGLGKNLLFKSALGHCEMAEKKGREGLWLFFWEN